MPQAIQAAPVVLLLPWPPSVNHYWQSAGNKRYLSAAARDFRREVWARVRQVGAAGFGDLPLEIEIEAHPPDHRRRDIDNLLKGLLDALQHAGLYEDDSQIYTLRVNRREVAKSGQLVVSVRVKEIA